LSLTRGDGGQNLIGPQLESYWSNQDTSIRGKKIDGEQFFQEPMILVFLQNPDETLNIWDKQKYWLM
jgi:hypothetical protein